MAGFSAPGVYRREIDLSDILVPTGSSNGGIVIRSTQGPVRRPVLVSNSKEFVEIFGQPYYVSGLSNITYGAIGGELVPELGYGSYGALEFLKESNTLFVVRAYTNTGSASKDRYAAVEINSEAQYCSACATSAGPNAGIAILEGTPEVFDSRSRISTYEEYAKTGLAKSKLLVGYVGPGELGNNYAVTVETINPTCDWLYSYDQFPSELSATVKAVTATDPDGNLINIAAIWTSTSGGGPSTVYKYLPNASQIVKVQVFAKPNDNSWEELYSNVSDQEAKKIRVNPLEVFYGSLKPMRDLDGNDMFIERRINGLSKFIYVKANPAGFASGQAAPTASWTFPPSNATNTSAFLLPDGSDNAGFYVLNTDRLAKLAGGGVDYKTGLFGGEADFWQYFENREEIPVSILINTSSDIVDKQAVSNVCNVRKDAIATNPVGWVNTLTWQYITNSEHYGYASPSFMSLYAGYSKIYDSYNDKFVYIPNSILGAQIFARVDNISYPWFAPAGVARATVSVLDQNAIFSTDSIGRMYDKNINALKLVQGAGFVIWGQKTAQLKKTALDRINVRRNLIYIELNIERALNQFVFENNTQQTRLRVFSLVDEFLAGVLASEGLYSYDVVCDETNNPPSVIDANTMNVDIYLQPVRTAEFIQFTTVVTRTGVSFSDVRLKYA